MSNIRPLGRKVLPLMFGLPIVLAAFAMMGTPAQLPVDCNPAVQADGLTTQVGSDESGWTATRIDFGPQVCAGLLYLASTPDGQARLRQLNPDTDFTWLSGVAMLVVLHEAHHGTGDVDEARTECLALKALRLFVRERAQPVQVEAIIETAREYDRDLPAAYHGERC